jgi:hypothetical protein
MLDPSFGDVLRRENLAHLVTGWSHAGEIFFIEPASEDERARITALVAEHDPMPALRRQAFVRLMADGNAITGQITGAYSDAEARSWVVQEMEARQVEAGAALPADALLPGLAADKGVPVEDYAAGVIAKADRFRPIARAGVMLRRAAEAVLDPALDTPEKLVAAEAQVREAGQAKVEEMGL